MKRWSRALTCVTLAAPAVAGAQQAAPDLVGKWTVVAPPRDPDNWRTLPSVLDLRPDSTGSYTFMKNKRQQADSTVPIYGWRASKDTMFLIFDNTPDRRGPAMGFVLFRQEENHLVLYPDLPDSSRTVYERSTAP